MIIRNWDSTFTSFMSTISRPSLPASRGHFSFLFDGWTNERKRGLCHGSKRPLLSRRPRSWTDTFKTQAPCIALLTVTWAHWVSRIHLKFFCCHLIMCLKKHVTVRSLSNRGACSTKAILAHSRGILDSRVLPFAHDWRREGSGKLCLAVAKIWLKRPQSACSSILLAKIKTQSAERDLKSLFSSSRSILVLWNER